MVEQTTCVEGSFCTHSFDNVIRALGRAFGPTKIPVQRDYLLSPRKSGKKNRKNRCMCMLLSSSYLFVKVTIQQKHCKESSEVSGQVRQRSTYDCLSKQTE